MFGLCKKQKNPSPRTAKRLSKTVIKTLGTFIVGSLCWSSAEAARQAEYLDRGVVALPSSNGVYVGWRMLGDDPSNISFNVYRNGTKITANPITNSTNYFDASGTTGSAYTVRPIINGAELAANAAKATWTNPYLLVNLQKPRDGTTLTGEAYSYSPNDLSVGDLDGDGDYEIIVKWDPSNSKDNSQSGYTGNVFIDAYNINGTQLWRIDLGQNIRAGAHYTQFMVYDLDGDGKAEVAMKTAPGTRDATGLVLGGSNADKDYRNTSGKIVTGDEYLTIFNGQTGAAMATTNYVPGRGDINAWGKANDNANRVDRFLAGIGYFDGTRPSLIMARGYYGRAVVATWDWRDGKLTQRWVFDSNTSGNGGVAGQGAHSLSVGDVDADGKDEIIYGAAAIDDNGKFLYSTKLGHGDALHLGDLDPTRAGMEVYMVHEDANAAYGAEMHDAKTGQILWGIPGGTDVGRGVNMDIDPRHAGNESWASVGGLYTAKGVLIGNTKPNSMNFSVFWDGDLLSEQLNNTMINKWNYTSSTDSRLLTAYNFRAASNNSTKATPGLSADVLGDWREEVIWRMDNNAQLIIFSTTAVTTNKLRTLMHDSQYRQEVARQNVAYNQPPHTSFFLGNGMATPPAPSLYFVGKNPNATVPVRSSSSSVTTSRSSSVVPVSSSSRSSSVVSVSSSSRSSSVLPVSSSSRSSSSSIVSTSRSSSSVASSSSSQATGGASCSYVVTNQWGTGFTGAIRISNNGSSAINGWKVSWSYSKGSNVSGTWNATVTGSNPYSATGLSWNSTINPGQTVEFGFQGNQPANANEIPTVTGSVCN